MKKFRFTIQNHKFILSEYYLHVLLVDLNTITVSTLHSKHVDRFTGQQKRQHIAAFSVVPCYAIVVINRISIVATCARVA